MIAAWSISYVGCEIDFLAASRTDDSCGSCFFLLLGWCLFDRMMVMPFSDCHQFSLCYISLFFHILYSPFLFSSGYTRLLLNRKTSDEEASSG